MEHNSPAATKKMHRIPFLGLTLESPSTPEALNARLTPASMLTDITEQLRANGDRADVSRQPAQPLLSLSHDTSTGTPSMAVRVPTSPDEDVTSEVTPLEEVHHQGQQVPWTQLHVIKEHGSGVEVSEERDVVCSGITDDTTSCLERPSVKVDASTLLACMLKQKACESTHDLAFVHILEGAWNLQAEDDVVSASIAPRATPRSSGGEVCLSPQLVAGGAWGRWSAETSASEAIGSCTVPGASKDAGGKLDDDSDTPRLKRSRSAVAGAGTINALCLSTGFATVRKPSDDGSLDHPSSINAAAPTTMLAHQEGAWQPRSQSQSVGQLHASPLHAARPHSAPVSALCSSSGSPGQESAENDCQLCGEPTLATPLAVGQPTQHSNRNASCDATKSAQYGPVCWGSAGEATVQLARPHSCYEDSPSRLAPLQNNEEAAPCLRLSPPTAVSKYAGIAAAACAADLPVGKPACFSDENARPRTPPDGRKDIADTMYADATERGLREEAQPAQICQGCTSDSVLVSAAVQCSLPVEYPVGPTVNAVMPCTALLPQTHPALEVDAWRVAASEAPQRQLHVVQQFVAESVVPTLNQCALSIAEHPVVRPSASTLLS
jgi:hypothetical protein